MKQLKWTAMAVAGMMIGMNMSCHHEMFDEGKYNDIVDSISPVDSVDANHTWTLAVPKGLVVQAPEREGIQKVRVLTANPRETGDAEVVGEAWLSSGEKITMTITYPSTITTLYAALVDDEGTYSIIKFLPDLESSISFDGDLLVDREKLSYEPQPQQYTYCYEEEYPAPGDYDYNDVVLRISQERTGKREMRINVQLAAVGASDQMAAALRLVGFKYSDIESVRTVDSLSFNTTNGQNLPNEMKTVVPSSNENFYNSFLSSGIHDEAVINLFGDAHWATGDLLDVDFGQMTRKKYNVSKTVGSNKNGGYQQFVPRTVSYIVTFKSAAGLDGLSMDQLDPFIMVMYNGGTFEVHQYTYSESWVFTNYSPSQIKNLPWALCVPKKNFRWPLEGVNVGFIMREVHTFGAYQTYEHSFGEWAMDRKKALDWYNYPTENQVFYSI